MLRKFETVEAFINMMRINRSDQIDRMCDGQTTVLGMLRRDVTSIAISIDAVTEYRNFHHYAGDTLDIEN